MKNLFNNLPLSPSRLDASQFLLRYFKKNLKTNDRIIDMGCGKLFLLSLIDQIGLDVLYTGIDNNLPEKIHQTKKRKFIKADITKYKDNKRYDFATCLWVLEHIRDDEGALEKIHEVLSYNGKLIVAVPSIWTWPIEFGRHGFHYYSKKTILEKVKNAGFNVNATYEAGGILGFIFMLIYSWPRYIILILLLPLFILIKFWRKKKINWKDFSINAIRCTMYRYHRNMELISIHNRIVREIVKLDNKFKVFPSSYILILQKNEKTAS